MKICLLTATGDMRLEGAVTTKTLCVRREAASGRAPLNSHYIESECFRVSIPKSGDYKSSHNGTMYVCVERLKFAV